MVGKLVHQLKVFLVVERLEATRTEQKVGNAVQRIAMEQYLGEDSANVKSKVDQETSTHT